VFSTLVIGDGGKENDATNCRRLNLWGKKKYFLAERKKEKRSGSHSKGKKKEKRQKDSHG